MKGFLGAVIAILLAAGAVAVVLDNRPVEVRTVPTDESRLRPGQAEVTGAATLAQADSAVGPPLAMPLNIPKGQATITGALVGGTRVSIVWDGGRPMALSGTGSGNAGSLDAAGASVEVTAAGVRWLLDGEPRSLAPGRYTVVAPVAVGAAGLAAPRDRVDFTADTQTTVTTRGGASVLLPLGPITLEGPGAVRLEGRLRVRTGTASARPAGAASFGAAPYRMMLTPGPSGLQLVGLFEGPRHG
ncbi:MAG TPA: hypothetical protein VGO92_13710 [Acidimicrobiales bacterium]|nr:hypothetical protein [Acidimicrobiales bacterium]